MIISMAMTIEMLEFLKLYDKTIHKIHGKFKLRHLEIGKLLKCWTPTDKYGNTYYRNLTNKHTRAPILGKDYIIEPKIKNQPGQRTYKIYLSRCYDTILRRLSMFLNRS